MNNILVWFAIVFGVVLCVVLFRHIAKTLKIIKATELAKAQHQAASDARRENAVMSIKVLAQSMLDGQVELSEGCIRVKILLDHVAPLLHQDAAFSVFSTLYDALQHMPTHEARKQSDKQLVAQLDQERFKLEADYRTRILEASKALLNYVF
jgi:hypothetical protein